MNYNVLEDTNIMENRQKIIIDTDCGSDDAMAIAMALNDENYEILMINTVTGNVRVEQAIANTLTTIKVAASYAPPVYRGASETLVRDWVGAQDVHGNDGMGDFDLVDYSMKPAEGNGILKMLEVLKENEEGTIDIITLGPLTNIALGILLDPETMSRASRIVMMASAGLGWGNVSPVAEFNIWQDPEACKIVLDSQIREKVFVGWDACLDEAMLTSQEIDEIRESGPLGRFCIDSNIVLMNMNKERFGSKCLDMADPAAMAAALYPPCIMDYDKYYCEVDISKGPCYGALLVDNFRFSGKQPNAYIVSRLKPDLYKQYIYKTLKVK